MSGPSGRSVLSSDLGTLGLADLVRDLESADPLSVPGSEVPALLPSNEPLSTP